MLLNNIVLSILLRPCVVLLSLYFALRHCNVFACCFVIELNAVANLVKGTQQQRLHLDSRLCAGTPSSWESSEVVCQDKLASKELLCLYDVFALPCYRFNWSAKTAPATIARRLNTIRGVRKLTWESSFSKSYLENVLLQHTPIKTLMNIQSAVTQNIKNGIFPRFYPELPHMSQRYSV